MEKSHSTTGEQSAHLSDLPDVDVIIATHNRPELLKVALEAVLRQSYAGRITIYLVFDQSDPDLSLAREGDDRRVIVVANDERTPGLAGARNTGITAGSAPFVAFCDDDDEWLPSKVASQIDELIRSGHPTSVTGIIIDYGEHQNVRIPTPSRMNFAELIRDRVMEAHPSTVMVRRSALEGPIGLVDEALPGSYAEDYDWILRAAKVGGFAVVPEALVRVRWGQSLFSTRWQIIADAMDYMLTKHPEFLESPKGCALLYGRKAFALAAVGRRREALSTAYAAWRRNPRERRAYLGAAVALRLVSAPRLMDMAHKRGRGI